MLREGIPEQTGRGSRRGLLLAICGIDGSGKTTQEVLLADWLSSLGRTVLRTQQPTAWFRQTPEVREYLDYGKDSLGMHGLALFAAADRQRHIRGVIAPAIEQGRDVICNRYVYSTLAYFMARGLSLSFVRQINPAIPVPDLTILLNLPATVARDRVRRRDGDVVKFEEKGIDFMEQVRKNFLFVADESFLIIDATTTDDQVHRTIRGRVEPLLAECTAQSFQTVHDG